MVLAPVGLLIHPSQAGSSLAPGRLRKQVTAWKISCLPSWEAALAANLSRLLGIVGVFIAGCELKVRCDRVLLETVDIGLKFRFC